MESSDAVRPIGSTDTTMSVSVRPPWSLVRLSTPISRTLIRPSGAGVGPVVVPGSSPTKRSRRAGAEPLASAMPAQVGQMRSAVS